MRTEDFIFNAIPYVIVGLIVVGLLATCASVVDEIEQKEKFMNECLVYEKEYECTYKWRVSRLKSNDIPVVYSIN